MQHSEDNNIKKKFKSRRIRQLVAIVTTLFLLLLIALLYDHTHLLDGFARNDVLSVQILLLCAFVGFSSYNWKCPSCSRYIGPDVNLSSCRHCGAKLR